MDNFLGCILKNKSYETRDVVRGVEKLYSIVKCGTASSALS